VPFVEPFFAGGRGRSEEKVRHKTQVCVVVFHSLLPLLRIARVAANSCSKRTFGSRTTIDGVAFNLKKWDRTFLEGFFQHSFSLEAIC
jgi:hypothetical protein